MTTKLYKFNLIEAKLASCNFLRETVTPQSLKRPDDLSSLARLVMLLKEVLFLLLDFKQII